MYTRICMCLEFGFDFKSTQKSFILGCAGSSLLHVGFLYHGKWGLLPSCGDRGYSLVATCGLLLAVAALVDTGSRVNSLCSLLHLLNWQEGSLMLMKQLSLLTIS